MNHSTKLAVGAACVLAVVVTVTTLRTRHDVPTLTKNAPQIAPQERVTSTDSASDVAPTEPEALRASEEPIVIPPLPANATSVPDADLLKLSAMVNLPNAEERRIDKEQWGRALPIARQLVQGPCDCEQRNWLNHYIEMGENALAGSNDAYFKLAILMQKMARNDKQLADDPGRIMR